MWAGMFETLHAHLESSLGKYGFVLLDNTPTFAFVGVATSLGMISLAWLITRKQKRNLNSINQPGNETDSTLLDDNDDELSPEDIKKVTSFKSEDYSKYIDPDDLKAPGLSESDKNVISRIKIARQRAINKKVEENLTKQEKVKEKMAETQQLAKIFSLLSENEDKFGKVSIDDIKDQMNMYKAE